MAVFNAETTAPRHRFVDKPLAIRIKGKAAVFFWRSSVSVRSLV